MDITDIIANTVGFDAVLDAHSHSVIEKMTVKNKNGEDVLLSSTGRRNLMMRSGLTFSLNTALPSSVKKDENGFFESVDGDYRVYNVKVLDKESGEYRDEGTLDIELLENYIVYYLGGVIGEEYAEPQGRISITEGYVND